MEQAHDTRPSPLRGLVKGLLYLIVKPIVLLILAFRNHFLPAVIVTIAVVGSLFWLATNQVAVPGVGKLGMGSEPAAVGSPRIAAEAYLTGSKEFAAQMIWDTYSDELKQRKQRNGETLEATQRSLNQMKQQGFKITGYKYVFGTTLDDGNSVHLYIVSMSVTTPQGEQSGQQPYTFTINPQGKIVNVD